VILFLLVPVYFLVNGSRDVVDPTGHLALGIKSPAVGKVIKQGNEIALPVHRDPRKVPADTFAIFRHSF
jgi:hypothetical protein